MPSRSILRRLLPLAAALFLSHAAQTSAQVQNDRPREHFLNAEIVPAIFFVGWLSCDSVEYPRGETDGFGAIFWRLIESSGFATMRLDKEGVGESAGDCGKTDFLTELSGYRAAFDSLGKYPFIDLDRVVVIGLSNGGGTSPLIAQSHHVRGYIAASSWGRTWYEHMLELERVRLSSQSSQTAAEINSALKKFTDFYSLYLIHKRKPGEIVKAHPEWANLWYDEADGQYGRPAAFYQQLQDLNLGEAWSAVNAPVLVLHGSSDSIMSHNDSVAIADIVNRKTPGRAEFVEIHDGDHLLSVHGKLADSVIPTMLQWINKQLR